MKGEHSKQQGSTSRKFNFNCKPDTSSSQLQEDSELSEDCTGSVATEHSRTEWKKSSSTEDSMKGEHSKQQGSTSRKFNFNCKPDTSSSQLQEDSEDSTGSVATEYSRTEWSSEGEVQSSGSEYKPGSSTSRVSDSDESTDHSEIYPALSLNMGVKSTSTLEQRDQRNFVSSTSSQDVVTSTSTPEKQGGVKVCSMQKHKWDKKHCCLFCKKFVLKMSTHLQRVHYKEAKVARIMQMPKGSRERRQEFIKLQDSGDYKNNYKVLQQQKGLLIPKYRKTDRQPADFMVCLHCNGLYLRRLVAKHTRTCAQNTEGAVHKKGHAVQIGKLLLPISKSTSSSFYENVLMKMRHDDILQLIEGDKLILQFGERIFGRRDVEENTRGEIRSRLRELGRLLNQVRTRSDLKVVTLEAAIDPINFDLLISCVKELADFEESSHTFSKGNLALRIGYSLKKCVKILKSEAIKTHDSTLRDKMERFESLYDGEWYDSVSACASQSITRAKMNKPKLLPSLADVEKVHKLLEKDCQSDSYPTLAKAVLCSVSIFNRKRGGELQRMKVEDYEKNKKTAMNPPDKEILANLSKTEQKLVSKLSRAEIRGKFNRPVPILLTPEMVRNIERLLSLRCAQGIDSSYLFVTPTGQQPYKGPAVLKQYATAAGVSEPSLFTCTSLRKQLATLSQAMEVSKMDQDQLAAFLGHDIRVHRNIYRQPIEVIQKAKVAKILLQVNRGVTVTDDVSDNLEGEEIEPELQTQESSDEEEDEGGDKNSQESKAHTVSLQSGEKNKCPSQTVTQPRKKQAKREEEDEGGDKNSQESKAHTVSLQSGKKNKCPSQTVTQPRKKQAKRPWTKDQKEAIHRHLSHCLVLNRVPQKHEAEQALASEKTLRGRTWKDVKYFVYNLLKKENKKRGS
ncbi:uncharacterized protein [Littorina saxatilis]|uniref:uncharacterized protein n=1 Tax=Littorina saxatilis TaxID=31220 RepID=UPI0038B5192F